MCEEDQPEPGLAASFLPYYWQQGGVQAPGRWQAGEAGLDTWTVTATAIVIMQSHILKHVIITRYMLYDEEIKSSSAKRQSRLAMEKSSDSSALEEEHGHLAEVEVDEMPAEKLVKRFSGASAQVAVGRRVILRGSRQLQAMTMFPSCSPCRCDFKTVFVLSPAFFIPVSVSFESYNGDFSWKWT